MMATDLLGNGIDDGLIYEATESFFVGETRVLVGERYRGNHPAVAKAGVYFAPVSTPTDELRKAKSQRQGEYQERESARLHKAEQARLRIIEGLRREHAAKAEEWRRLREQAARDAGAKV
jgi:hypothetical protein